MKKIIIIDNSKFISFFIRSKLYKSLSLDNKVIVYYLREDMKAEKEKFISNNFLYKKINIKSFFKLIYDIWTSKKLLTFTIRPLIIGFLAKIFSPNLDFYPTITGTGPLFDSELLVYKFLRLVYPLFLYKAKHTFFHNKSDALYFSKKLKTLDYTITGGSGVEVPTSPIKRNCYSLNKKLPKIACFSRLIKDKGILHYFDATKMIFEKYPFMKGRFFLAGIKYKGNLKNNTIEIEQVKDWENYGGIYIGQPKCKKDFYLSMDVICLPSFREGLSNVLLEAGSLGCILMSTDVPGCIDIIDNECGIIFKAKSTKSLFKAFEKTINLNLNNQKSLRDNAYKKISYNFSKKRVINDYLRVI